MCTAAKCRRQRRSRRMSRQCAARRSHSVPPVRGDRRIDDSSYNAFLGKMVTGASTAGLGSGAVNLAEAPLNPDPFRVSMPNRELTGQTRVIADSSSNAPEAKSNAGPSRPRFNRVSATDISDTPIPIRSKRSAFPTFSCMALSYSERKRAPCQSRRASRQSKNQATNSSCPRRAERRDADGGAQTSGPPRPAQPAFGGPRRAERGARARRVVLRRVTPGASRFLDREPPPERCGALFQGVRFAHEIRKVFGAGELE